MTEIITREQGMGKLDDLRDSLTHDQACDAGLPGASARCAGQPALLPGHRRVPAVRAADRARRARRNMGASVTAWVRVEPGECDCHRPAQVHTRWELPGETHPSGALKTAGRIISDEAIRTFGRARIERLLAGLPALPEAAWSVLS